VYGYKEIAKWLCSLCDDYYIEIKNNEIINYKIVNLYDKFLDDKIKISKMIKRLKFKIF
jgi:hypothetical protein